MALTRIPCARQLERGGADEVDHRRLARVVAVARHRLDPEAGVRGRDDDAARALRLHHARGAPHRVHDAGEVHAEDPVPVGALDRVERLPVLEPEAGHGSEARVGEHDVHSALRVDDVVEERLNGVLVADVRDCLARVEPARAQRLGARREPLLVDVGKRDPGAALREHLGHREAEPARRARDDRPRSPDVEEPLLDARHGTRTARPVTSPSRSLSSTSFTSSRRCVSLRSVTSPRAWSWRSSQRSIQLPTRLPTSDVSPDDEADRRVRDRAAVADDRVDALPREHPERGGVRLVGADEVDDDVDAGAVRQLSRGARDVRLLAEDLVGAELAREPAAPLVGVDRDHPGGAEHADELERRCARPRRRRSRPPCFPGSRRGTSFFTAW